jgi:undecaprenyl-diphosphatase
MSIFEALALGVLQGITEFFPISSSGHLVLLEEFLGFRAPDLIAFNVLLHLATLFAVVIYFRKQLFDIAKGILSKDKKQLRLFWALVIGTIPAVIIGLSFSDIVEQNLSSSFPVLIAMFCTGIFFLIAEKYQKNHPKKEGVSIKKGFWIGLAQAAALIPGVSRSGSTLATGLFFKMDREESASYSFLLAIPAIAGASLLTALDLQKKSFEIDYLSYAVGFFTALICGYFAISILMNLYKKHSLKVFAGYLIFASILLLLL